MWLKSKRQIGSDSEDHACDYLRRQGLKLLDKNYHAKCGELDLIMQDGTTLVFVEVKYRRSAHFGHAQESVTIDKQRKLIKTAHHWLLSRKHSPYDTDYRFDVIAIHGQNQIEWFKSAFYEG